MRRDRSFFYREMWRIHQKRAIMDGEERLDAFAFYLTDEGFKQFADRLLESPYPLELLAAWYRGIVPPAITDSDHQFSPCLN